MTKIKKHGFNIVNLSIILLALSFYVSTVFDAGASQDKHEGAIPVRGTAETREDIGAEERERICSLDSVICPVGEVHSTGGVSPSGTRISPTSPAGKIPDQIRAIAERENFPYVSYLLRLSYCESRWNPLAVGDGKYNSRGLYQISKHYHPQVTDAMAFDVEQSTLWTMKQIMAGRQSLWSCDRIIKNT